MGHQGVISVWLLVAVHAMSGQTTATRPQAGQSPASPSCALSLQPIVAKQRELLPDWFGYLLLARAVVSEFEPKLAAEDSYRPAMLELRTVHRGRWN